MPDYVEELVQLVARETGVPRELLGEPGLSGRALRALVRRRTVSSATMMPCHDHEQVGFEWAPPTGDGSGWDGGGNYHSPGGPLLNRPILYSLYAHDERCPGGLCGPCGGEGGSGAGTCLYCGGDGQCKGCNAYNQWEWRWRLMCQDSYRVMT